MHLDFDSHSFIKFSPLIQHFFLLLNGFGIRHLKYSTKIAKSVLCQQLMVKDISCSHNYSQINYPREENINTYITHTIMYFALYWCTVMNLISFRK